MSSYRIITNGKQFKVQRRCMVFWWTDEGRFGFSSGIPGMDDGGYSFEPYLFHTAAEAERHIQDTKVKAIQHRPPRWHVVKVIKS